MIKLLFWIVIIYLGYQFYAKSQWRISQGSSDMTGRKNVKEDEDFIDYEEID